MSAKTDQLESELIQHLFGGVAAAVPTEWWIALYDADPTDAVTGAAWNGNPANTPAAISNRLEVLNWTITDNEVVNTDTLEWPAVPVGQTWTVSHFVIFDAEIDGRPLYHGAFRTAKELSEGDILFVASGQLVIREL